MSNWIAVNDERKPDLASGEDSISVPVLLFVPTWLRDDDTGIRLGHYMHKSKVFRPNGSTGYEKDVTHWMPLPDPPKELQ